jgi:thiamine-phosphate pyrophosphorylase
VRGLYPIICVDSLAASKLPLLDYARALLTARPELVQLRAKHLSARQTVELLRALRPLCSAAKVALFANDRPDLALIAGCDGVHVGQDDLPVRDVRAFARGLKVGVSTHDAAQLASALEAGPDYVAFGPVFPTKSKDRPDPVVGLEGLSRAERAARAAGCPLVAIGGITLDNAPSIAAIGAAGSVIGALVPPDGDLAAVPERARALHAALGGA